MGYMNWKGTAPAKAGANFAVGDLIVAEAATGLALPGSAGTVDHFIGFCPFAFDNTLGLDGSIAYNAQVRTIEWDIGIHPVEAAAGVTPYFGMRCYLATRNTFSNLPIGPFIGHALKPSHLGTSTMTVWNINMWPSISERGSGNTFDLVVTIPDISSPQSVWISPNRAGRILSIRSVIDAAVTIGDAILTTEINGTLVTGSSITISNAGSAAGDVDTATPTAANVFAAGDKIEVITDGGSTDVSKATVVLTCQG